MRRISKALILPAALLLLAPTHGLAESVSKHLTGGAACVDCVDFGVIVSKPGVGRYPDVRTGRNDPASSVDIGVGAAVNASEAVRSLCAEAVATGYTCSEILACNDPPAPGTATDCCTTVGDVFQDIDCSIATGGPLGGFNLSHALGSEVFVVTPAFGSNLNAVVESNRSGIAIGTDLLSMFCLRVDKNAVDGTVNFSVRHFHGTTGGVQTSNFSVNTTGLSDSAIQAAVTAGLSAAVPNLELGVMDSPGQKCAFSNEFDGPLVSVWNLPGSGVLELTVDGLAGQNIVAESSGGSGQAQIPTLSEWGLILLVALLSLSALWMLRRRRQVIRPI